VTSRRQAFSLIGGMPAAVAAGAVALTRCAEGAEGTALKIAPKSKLVIIGDSITDAGRARPVGEGMFDALGRGYVAQVDALLGAVYPDYAIRVVNMGTSGHTVRDLKARWQTDVIDLKPDWVAVMVGANDVWRQFDSPQRTEQHVPLPEYEKTYGELIVTTKPLVKGLVLMTPYYIEPNRADLMRAQMDRYGAVVKALAGRHGAVLVDTQAAFDEVLKSYYAATLAWDRVHPNAVGCMVLARAFVNAVGFSWKR
jgi:lysophospholipase L1-like esterase